MEYKFNTKWAGIDFESVLAETQFAWFLLLKDGKKIWFPKTWSKVDKADKIVMLPERVWNFIKEGKHMQKYQPEDDAQLKLF